MNPRALPGWLVAVGVAGVVLLGCSGDDSGRPSDDVRAAETTAEATTTTTRPEVVRRDAGVDLPRGFTYGHVEFELTKVEFANAAPGSYLDDEPDAIDGDLLFVSFTAAFEADVVGVSDEWTVDNFKLVTGAGRTIAASAVDFVAVVGVEAGTPTEATVVFPATEADLAGATFLLDDGVRAPVGVPLEAAVPPGP